jgi:DNA-binding beta-propeller fold protein YncE
VPNIGATGLAFDAAGVAYVAGYDTNGVYRFDRDGSALGPAFIPGTGGLRGPDNGMTFGPDGNLYIPGYDSGNVVRWNPPTSATSIPVQTGAAGLFKTRGLLFSRDGQSMFITSEGSGTILRWNRSNGAVTVLTSGLLEPRGIDYAPDGKLLVSNNDNTVIRVDPDTGAVLGTFIPADANVRGIVFLAVIAKPGAAAVDLTQVGSQYWVVGDGRSAAACSSSTR